MATTVRVRDHTTTVAVDTADYPRGVAFTDELSGAGSASVEGMVHLHGAALYDGQPIVAVEVGGSEVFAFVVEPPRQREQTDTGIRESVQGRHVMAVIFDACIVEPPAFVCDELVVPADTIYYGWQHPEYDDSAWLGATSLGTVEDQPFPTYRPTDWPSPTSHFIWVDGNEAPDGAVGYFRKTFTVAADVDVVLVVSADDFYDLYLDGVLLSSSESLFFWKTFDEIPMNLCAGTHTLAIRVANAYRPTATHPAWPLVAVVTADDEGNPASTNQIYEIYTTATGGLFTLSVSGVATGGLAYNVSSGSMQTALEALSTVGAGNVTVTGAGTVPADQVNSAWADATSGMFSFTVDGLVAPAIAWNASAAQVEAALEALANVDGVTVTGAGTSGSPWVITFDGPTVSRQSLTLDSNDTGLSGGSSTIQISTTQSASAGDPWIVEFVSSLSSTPVLMTGDGSSLTGGTLTGPTETQAGLAADVIVETDTTWKYHDDSSIPGMTWGQIHRLLVEQAQATGHVPNVTHSYSDTQDSGGNNWTGLYSIPVSVGTTLWSVFDLFADRGVDHDMNSTLVFAVYEGRGADLSGGVEFDLTDDSLNWDAVEDPEIINRGVMRHAKGYVTVEASGLAGGTERRTEFLSQGNANTADIAAASGQPFVDAHVTPRRDVRWTWPAVGTTQPDPYSDFDLGDTVRAVGWNGAATDVRVIGISLAENDDTGVLEWVCRGVLQ